MALPSPVQSPDRHLAPKELFYLTPIKIVGSSNPEAFSLGEMLSQLHVQLSEKELRESAAKCLKRTEVRYMAPGNMPCLVTQGLGPDEVAALLSKVAADQMHQTPPQLSAKVADLLSALRDPEMYGFKPNCKPDGKQKRYERDQMHKKDEAWRKRRAEYDANYYKQTGKAKKRNKPTESDV